MANMNKALGTDLAALAQLLRSKGRGKDSVLAHITPKEAALLKRRGGSGSTNPDTGLPEYEDSESYDYNPPAPIVESSAPVTDNSEPWSSPVETAPQQDRGIQPQTFDPQNYDPFGGGGSPIYRGDPNQPTPTYASGVPNAATSFGGGGALVDTNKPGSATALEPADGTTTTATGDGKGEGKGTPSSMSDLLKGLGLTGNQVARLGLGGALGAYGASQARKTADQIASAQSQQQQLATPYQSQGKQLVSQAQQGQLTPASQQAYAAAKAQQNQAQANRGGVGSQQASNQLAQIYQTLLDNQYNYGLKIMNIGDNIAMGAIKTGLQMDAQLNAATTNFYSQLANYVSGGNMQAPQQSPIQAQIG